MPNPPGSASVPILHVVPSAPTPTSVAVTPIAEYDIAGPAAGAAAGGAAGAAGVGAAIAVPAGAAAVGVGGGGGVGRRSLRAWPGGTCSPGVVDGSGGPGALEAFCCGAASRDGTQSMTNRYCLIGGD